MRLPSRARRPCRTPADAGSELQLSQSPYPRDTAQKRGQDCRLKTHRDSEPAPGTSAARAGCKPASLHADCGLCASEPGDSLQRSVSAAPVRPAYRSVPQQACPPVRHSVQQESKPPAPLRASPQRTVYPPVPPWQTLPAPAPESAAYRESCVR